ncbi:MAG TPA: hypothetical protein VJC00_01095 [Candidatus Nanoarchaeia archaeon]|nr:hypothetical protein [Candidatus Nanoarchaeia archaeon]
MTKNNKQTKKDMAYVWISLVLLLFVWVPVLNVLFFIPASLYFSITALTRAKKEPEKYRGLVFAAVLVVIGAISFLVSLYYLVYFSGEMQA